MKLVIFGANGSTGRLLTEQALEAGHTVTAFTRHADAFPIHHERLHVVQGDAFDPAAVRQAVAGQDAVLSSLGTRYSRKPITLYSGRRREHRTGDARPAGSPPGPASAEGSPIR